jgi:hypothetical protein
VRSWLKTNNNNSKEQNKGEDFFGHFRTSLKLPSCFEIIPFKKGENDV